MMVMDNFCKKKRILGTFHNYARSTCRGRLDEGLTKFPKIYKPPHRLKAPEGRHLPSSIVRTYKY
jgi:hypothetical protein